MRDTVLYCPYCGLPSQRHADDCVRVKTPAVAWIFTAADLDAAVAKATKDLEWQLAEVLKQRDGDIAFEVEHAVTAERAKAHKWRKLKRDYFFSCETCGAVLRADGKNSDCKGPVYIRARGWAKT